MKIKESTATIEVTREQLDLIKWSVACGMVDELNFGSGTGVRYARLKDLRAMLDHVETGQ